MQYPSQPTEAVLGAGLRAVEEACLEQGRRGLQGAVQVFRRVSGVEGGGQLPQAPQDGSMDGGKHQVLPVRIVDRQCCNRRVTLNTLI